MKFTTEFWTTYEKTTDKDFGKFISIVFNNMELKPKDMAKEFLVSEAYMRSIKAGTKKPSKRLVRSLFEYLVFDPKYFPKCMEIISNNKDDYKANFFIIACIILSNKEKATANDLAEFIKNEI